MLRSNQPNETAQRYIVARARALGHIDMLPTSWTNMTTKTSANNLDMQLDAIAAQHGLSSVQLKTVYLRGVNEFFSSDLAYGSASMYGLARVQRFVNERGSLIDSDLAAQDKLEGLVDSGLEFDLDSAAVLFEVVYGTGERIAELFEPGEVTSISVGDDELCVKGTLGANNWLYVLNTATGADSFTVQ